MKARQYADKIWRTNNIENIGEFKVSLQSAIAMMEQYAELSLKEAGLKKCEHDLKKTRDKRYPYNPIRCTKCGYEP